MEAKQAQQYYDSLNKPSYKFGKVAILNEDDFEEVA